MEHEGLGETSRRLILSVLKGQAKTVNEIVQETGLRQPNVSNHLCRMRSRGIVKASKVGRQVFYNLASQEIQALVQSVVTVRRLSDSSLDYECLVDRFFEATTTGDEECAQLLFEEAFQANAQLLDIYDKLIAPTMRRVGSCYRSQAIHEAQEHMASEIILRLMARTVLVPGPAKKIGKSAVVGCIQGNFHTIGPRMAADFLRLSGWKIAFCGANVPVRSYLTSVFQNNPDLALIGCAVEDGYPAVEQLLRELKHLRLRQAHFSIGVGGNVVPEVAERFRLAGADFVCRDLRQFATQIIPVLESSGVVPPEVAWAS